VGNKSKLKIINNNINKINDILLKQEHICFINIDFINIELTKLFAIRLLLINVVNTKLFCILII